MAARARIRRLLAVGLPWIGGTLAALAVAGLLFAWSGLYNVGATSGHWSATVELLEFGLQSSVRTQSLGIDPPPLDDEGLARLGANHFALGCAPCHGAPGRPPSPITRAMLPEPPPLAGAAADWNTRELYWIVRNGLKFTGMPGWVAEERGDEVWSVVAFLEALPGISPDDYARLTSEGAHRLGDLGDGPDDAVTVRLCARCHDAAASRPVSALVPTLSGQTAAYLAAALEDFRAGARQSGIMQPIAAALDDETIEDVAIFYAGLQVPELPADDTDPEARRRGQAIATEGIPAERIPHCYSCHGDFAREVFPRLDGQNAAYIIRQLELFRAGVRADTPKARIMQAIAARLSDVQISDAAAYFESLGSRPGAQADAGADG